jgi:hypothetical protein
MSHSKVRKLLTMSLSELGGRGHQALWKLMDRAFLPISANRQLEGRVGGEPRSRIPIPGLADPDGVAEYLRSCHRRLADDIVSTANAVMDGKITVLGYGAIDFGLPPRWHEEPITGGTARRVHWSRIKPLDYATVGDSKIVWELNRHQFLVTLGQAYRLTGNSRYAERVWELVDAWIADNPPGCGINWASSLEVALRSIAWCWTWRLADGDQLLDPAAQLRLVRATEFHGRHVAKYLSHYFAPNTHLTGEALGLCYLATAWPYLKRSALWWELGSRILVREAEAQIRSDGMHFERSVCYHLYTLDFLLHYALLCHARSVRPPDVIVRAVARLADVAHALQRPDGLLPNIGDDDGGRLLLLGGRAFLDPSESLAMAASLLRTAKWWPGADRGVEAVWAIGVDDFHAAAALAETHPNTEMRERLHILSSSGFIVSRGDGGDYMAVSAGVQEPLPRCLGHLHDDALSVELWCAGKPVFVDPGTYTYTGDAQRRGWYRSAAAHNTGGVGGHPCSPGADPFQWTHLTGGRLAHHATGPHHHLLELVRDIGLASATVSHRRRIVAWHGSGWLIWDRFYGSGTHTVQLRFQLPAGEERPDAEDGCVSLSSAYAATLPRGPKGWSWEAVDSPISPSYGRSEPAFAWLLTAQTCLPTDVLTIVLRRASSSTPPRLAEAVVRRPAEVPWHGLCRAVEVRDGEDAICQRIFLQDDVERTIVVGDVSAPLRTVWLHGSAGGLLLAADGSAEGSGGHLEGWPPMIVDGEPAFGASRATAR